ncbi:hypothetical protein RUE5091_01056 [Ruegeria denitrificans]|uniref:Uncharacterized protein n=1 Tax=Ruegeria denitrificans TaxID=1715692 RepID=A0A0N7M8U5_9RHOB|nr:hypothetical protein [Ruegeria denitrificans]CUJ91081.1 hypothetical protein RUE5091_01056 [Ruegeria denitrificans]
MQIVQVIDPLVEVSPVLDDATLTLCAGSVFAVVHGAVKLTLEGRFGALGAGAVRSRLSEFALQVLRGYQAA